MPSLRSALLLLAMALAPRLVLAACTIPEVATKGVTGFQEAVVSVADLAAASATWREVGAFVPVCTGTADPAVVAFWGLPKGTVVDEVVMAKPGLGRGFVRLVKFNGVPQVQIRSSGMSWDTGGIFDLYMYVNDVHAVFAALRARGWQSYNDPVTYTLGPFTVTELMARGPNGEVLCLMQRDAPAYNKAEFGLVDGQPLGFGYPFNAALVSKDFAAGETLFGAVLGWKVHLSGDSKSQPPGDNPLGIPLNLAQSTSRKFAAFAPHPSDRNGSIQVIANIGLDGRDFSARAEPPNLGNLTLRVPMPDLKAFAAAFVKKGGAVAVPARTVALPPYGKVDILAIKAPNGARIEFFAAK
jgi:hypothetical protein